MSDSDILTCWQGGVRAVSPVSDQHSIHSYFNTCPESPDGRWVLYFASTTPEGHLGEVHILNRMTGEVRVLAQGVKTEDAHRVACQQWVLGGRQVVFHDFRDETWVVVAVDVETLEERVLAKGRQLAWGEPSSNLVPIYGMHWDPGEHRDLELLDVESGEVQIAVTVTQVLEAYSDWIVRQFGTSPVSIFFPSLGPDLKRIFFKMAAPAGGHFQSKQASVREGLICYDLEADRFLFLHERWGHPAWHPDGRTVINTPNVLIDTNTGESRPIPGLPKFPGAHPAISPDGRLFVTDTQMEVFGGTAGHWGVVIGMLEGHAFETMHTFDHTGGASSWRIAHPHPVFNREGNRVYFNVSEGRWTRLYVAERADLA